MPEQKYKSLANGYQPRATITKVVDGKSVQIPIAQLIIKPPQGGTGAITPREPIQRKGRKAK